MQLAPKEDVHANYYKTPLGQLSYIANFYYQRFAPNELNRKHVYETPRFIVPPYFLEESIMQKKKDMIMPEIFLQGKFSDTTPFSPPVVSIDKKGNEGKLHMWPMIAVNRLK